MTVITIFDDPNPLATGVKVTVQFGAVPAKTIFAVGSNAGFDDVTLKLADVHSNKLSISVIVNGRAAVDESSAIV